MPIAECIEKQDFDGRAYALALTSCRMLRALDLWNAVADQAQPILDIKVSDGRAGEGASPLFVHFDHRELGEGPMGHMIEDRHLRATLTEAINENPNVDMRYETALNDYAIDASGVTAKLGSERKWKEAKCAGKRSISGTKV